VVYESSLFSDIGEQPFVLLSLAFLPPGMCGLHLWQKEAMRFAAGHGEIAV
jgi:hypothetical protein